RPARRDTERVRPPGRPARASPKSGRESAPPPPGVSGVALAPRDWPLRLAVSHGGLTPTRSPVRKVRTPFGTRLPLRRTPSAVSPDSLASRDASPGRRLPVLLEKTPSALRVRTGSRRPNVVAIPPSPSQCAAVAPTRADDVPPGVPPAGPRDGRAGPA